MTIQNDVLKDALRQESLDACLKAIQEALGITDGNRAAHEFGHGDERVWAEMDQCERAHFIRHWLWKELEDAGDRALNAAAARYETRPAGKVAKPQQWVIVQNGQTVWHGPYGPTVQNAFVLFSGHVIVRAALPGELEGMAS